MSRHRTVTRFILGTVGLLALAGCAGGGATLVAAAPRLKVPAWAKTAPPLSGATLVAAAPRLKVPAWAKAAAPLPGAPLVAAAPRLKVPAWAKTAPPLSERHAARLIRDYGARRIGDVPFERDPSEVSLLFGAFTRPDAHEAIASVQSGLLGRRAWQAWLLEWRDSGWQAVRPIASNCSGRVEWALLDRRGPAALLVRDSCARFGQQEGQVRLIALGPTEDKVLFAAAESASGEAGGDALSVRHSVWLTGFDETGHADVVDLAFTERRVRTGGSAPMVITSTVTTYRPLDQGLVAVSTDNGSRPVERLASVSY